MTSGSPRLLVIFTLALGFVVAVVLLLATGSWWVLVLALLALFAAAGALHLAVSKRLAQASKPDPATEARLEQSPPRGDDSEERPDDPKMAW
jgi:membrane protein implicated in regulation of membrane protease activity